MTEQKLIAIVGPTASGKTDSAFELALLSNQHFRKTTEIISADSRQVYKHISIATSQPPLEYQKRVKHHFIDCLELEEDFNAGKFGKTGRQLINSLFIEAKFPIVVGGSGLYLRSLLYGLFEFYEGDKEFEKRRKNIRQQLNERIGNDGEQKLLEELRTIDPQAASSMTPQNKRRIIRALEVYYLTAMPISKHHSKKINISFEPVVFGLLWERKHLYEKINRRVDYMIANGLIEEVENLKKKGLHYKILNSLNTVGIKEVFDYLDGVLSYERMIESIKQNTRRFAKRQMTWFRGDKNIKWIEVKESFKPGKVASEILERYKAESQ